MNAPKTFLLAAVAVALFLIGSKREGPDTPLGKWHAEIAAQVAERDYLTEHQPASLTHPDRRSLPELNARIEASRDWLERNEEVHERLVEILSRKPGGQELTADERRTLEASQRSIDNLTKKADGVDQVRPTPVQVTVARPTPEIAKRQVDARSAAQRLNLQTQAEIRQKYGNAR